MQPSEPESHARAPAMQDRVFAGLRWVAASSALLQITRALVAIVLARLLSPSDYGVAVLVLVFSSLVLVFSDLALGAAIVQRKSLTDDDRSTAFWISVGSGVIFMVAGFALAGPIADLYGQPAVEPLCRVLSLSFLVSSLQVIPEALMLRDMRFRALELRMMAATIVSGAVAITVATSGGGPWAIIVQQLTTVLVSTILLWVLSSWRPRWRFSAASGRSLGTFSGYLVGHRLLFYLHRNADNFIIGRFVGPAALGAYAVAYNVMLAPFSKIGDPLQRVMWPTLSKMQDEPARMATTWLRVVRLLAMITVPSLMGLVVVAPDFIPLVLGDKWKPAVPLIQVLAWVGILQSLQGMNIDILMARNRTATIFRYSVFFTVAHIAAFVLGVRWGVLGVAIAYAVSSTLVEPVLTVLTSRAIGMSPWRFVRNLLPIFATGLAMAAVVFVGRGVLLDAGVALLPRFVLSVLLGGAVFLALCAWRMPDLRVEARHVLASLTRPGRLATEA
jgi:O-antigen/teichoic acid export membrane protein